MRLAHVIILLCCVIASVRTLRRIDKDLTNRVTRLKKSLKGYVFLRGEIDYEEARAVHNGVCRHIFPLLIVKPRSTRDVSKTVLFAKKNGIEMSVRSGGHSFQCLGTKDDSIHLDLRSLKKIEFLPPYNKVRFGSGLTWNQVLNVVDPEKYTVIHGNAKNVGVGGYLLGVGVNPIGTTHRHGFGADNVLRYKIVLADGSVALVNNDNTTIIQRYGKRVNEVYQHGYDDNLRYALRGSGPSFGIVTEFDYKVYQHPETLAAVLLVWIESSNDLEKLIQAGQDGRYGISIVQPLVLRRPKPVKWLAWTLIKAPQVLRWKADKKVEPVPVSVVDLQSNSGHTPAGPALDFLKSYGLEVAIDNIALMERAGLDRVNLVVDDQETIYLTEDELRAEGYHGMASANANGLTSYKAVEDLFFFHPTFGIYNKKTPRSKGTGCDFCLWILYIAKKGVNDNVIQDTSIGPLTFELDCTYDASDNVKAKQCPALVKAVQDKVYSNAKKYGQKPRQYVNTPGCNDQFFSFGQRYWGNSYDRLLKIKQRWDPDNLFNYCQSVGSTTENCCIVEG